MNEQEFWRQLQQEIYQNDGLLDSKWQKIIEIYAQPSLSIRLITQTIYHGPVYLDDHSSLNFPSVNPELPLSVNQQVALEMALSNSALSLIVGTSATGKTLIAKKIANIAVNSNKRLLILTHHCTSLTGYQNLPTYPFLLSQPLNYQQWIITQMRMQYLSQPQMDYLPIYLLPDLELAKLRSPGKLEKWLANIQQKSHPELLSLLQIEFPHLQIQRIELLADSLKKLESLLKQQLKLSQLYSNLSQLALQEISDQIIQNSQVPILGTVAEFIHPENKYLWQNNFDIIIIEESHHLNWIELILLAGLTNKLILIGEDIPQQQRQYNQTSLFKSFPYVFKYLSQKLLPAYVYRLKEQYRLHPDIAKQIYSTISNDWILTQRVTMSYDLPQIQHRLIWNDTPNDLVNQQILKFILDNNFDLEFLSDIGIITTTVAARDWLKENLPTEFQQIFIGTIPEWSNREKTLVILNCPGIENMAPEDTSIFLTRAKDYLILFGDYNFYLDSQSSSPISELLSQSKIYRERLVVLS
jgi:hypothetical protein